MLIAARTASRPASTTSHQLPGGLDDVISPAARWTARSVAWRIDSAAWPVSGATESASDARSGRAGIPAAVIAAAAGCADTSNGTPSGGQQPGSVQT
jgi:hypothetical protein